MFGISSHWNYLHTLLAAYYCLRLPFCCCCCREAKCSSTYCISLGVIKAITEIISLNLEHQTLCKKSVSQTCCKSVQLKHNTPSLRSSQSSFRCTRTLREKPARIRQQTRRNDREKRRGVPHTKVPASHSARGLMHSFPFWRYARRTSNSSIAHATGFGSTAVLPWSLYVIKAKHEVNLISVFNIGPLQKQINFTWPRLTFRLGTTLQNAIGTSWLGRIWKISSAGFWSK